MIVSKVERKYPQHLLGQQGTHPNYGDTGGSLLCSSLIQDEANKYKHTVDLPEGKMAQKTNDDDSECIDHHEGGGFPSEKSER